MLTIRPMRWPEDQDYLATIDTSFTTDRIYRVTQNKLSFRLAEEKVSVPLHKTYGSVLDQIDEIHAMEHVVVAQLDDHVVGLVAADFASWNRRARVWHIYVSPGIRRKGVGSALIESVLSFAQRMRARCLWVETQSINYPAIQFYRHMGFQICGLDTYLYDPEGSS